MIITYMTDGANGGEFQEPVDDSLKIYLQGVLGDDLVEIALLTARQCTLLLQIWEWWVCPIFSIFYHFKPFMTLLFFSETKIINFTVRSNISNMFM